MATSAESKGKAHNATIKVQEQDGTTVEPTVTTVSTDKGEDAVAAAQAEIDAAAEAERNRGRYGDQVVKQATADQPAEIVGDDERDDHA